MAESTRPAPRLPALDPATVTERKGSAYPAPFRERAAGHSKRALGDAAGLTNFGVNLVTLAPGAASSVRHWHARQDELVYVLEGEIPLVTDAAEQPLGPGMAAGFPAGRADGHHLVNRTKAAASYLEIGDRSPGDAVTYPDDDLEARQAASWRFAHKDGTPY